MEILKDWSVAQVVQCLLKKHEALGLIPGRKGGREGGMEGGREGGKKEGKEGGREGGREERSWSHNSEKANLDLDVFLSSI
jgi:hypothetical protein